jgi:hypothetical protein
MAEAQGGYYPVDNNTYNLLQSLVSKLEALEAYRKYEKDADSQSRQVFQNLIREDQEHARQLLDALKQALQRA